MKIQSINRVDAVQNVIKNTEKILDSSLTQFIDGITPITVLYYSQDYLNSTAGVGDRSSLGPYSGATKYKAIKNYIGYGYPDEKNTTMERNEKEDYKITLDSMQMLHLPNTITPKVNDRFSLKLENYQIMYVVTNVDQVTLHSKPFYRTEYKVDENLPYVPFTLEHMLKGGLISQELIFVQENLGTDYSPFLTEEKLGQVKEFNDAIDNIRDLYNDFFYHEYTNMILGSLDYSVFQYLPIIVDLQMEYFPLKIYDNNDMILYHESLNDVKSKAAYKQHIIKKFLKRKSNNLDNGIKFFKYEYYKDINDDYFKINTYMNSTDTYFIYDYVNGFRKTEYTLFLPERILYILNKWYNKEYTSMDKILLDIEDFEIEDQNIEWCLGVILLLIVLNFIFEELNISTKVERFY